MHYKNMQHNANYIGGVPPSATAGGAAISYCGTPPYN